MYSNTTLLIGGLVLAIICGLAFGIIVKVFVSYEIERWNRKPDETDNAGAVEGDARNPNQGDVR